MPTYFMLGWMRRDVDKEILKVMNGLRESEINPQIAKNVPPSLAVDIPASGSSGTCIIPNPFKHGCICHAGECTLTLVHLSPLRWMNHYYPLHARTDGASRS